MKKLVSFLVLAIFGLLILGGCSPRIHFPPKTEKTDQAFTTTYYNDSPAPVALECLKRGSVNLRESWHIIYPGESHTMTSRGGWETNCRLRFWSPQAGDFTGETMLDIPFRHSSLFSREIRITQLTLNQRSLQLGRVHNKSMEAMDIQDNYGNNYVLQPGQLRLYEIPSGALKISYKPVGLKNTNIGVQHFNVIVNNKPDSYWHYNQQTGEYMPIGWYVDINYFPSVWR